MALIAATLIDAVARRREVRRQTPLAPLPRNERLDAFVCEGCTFLPFS